MLDVSRVHVLTLVEGGGTMHLGIRARSTDVADTVESLSRSLLQRWSRLPDQPSELDKFFNEYSWRRPPSGLFPIIDTSVPEIFWTGIYGVGVGLRDEEYEFPLIIAHHDLINSNRTEEVLKEAFGIPVPSNLEYLGVEEPELDVVSCFCSGRGGTLGAAVVTQANTRACLTAGHVANPVGAHVSDPNGSLLGVVSFSQYPAIATPGRHSADVAVVDILDRDSLGHVFKGLGVGVPGDDVTMLGSSGTHSTKLLAYAPWVAVPSMIGIWGHIYLTGRAISQPGDSGAVVFASDAELPIGHVVGASRPATTYVQDLEFQLAISGTTLV